VTSMGGATALFVMAVFTLFWTDRPWVRVLCGVYVGAVIVLSLILNDGWELKLLPLGMFLILGLCLVNLPVITKRKSKKRPPSR